MSHFLCCAQGEWLSELLKYSSTVKSSITNLEKVLL